MIIRLEGDSMYPALKSGDMLSVDTTAYSFCGPQPGDIVLAHHPFKKSSWLVKRVHAVTHAEEYVLYGDNLLESTDSRSFGPLHRDKIVGKVSLLPL